jgi:hypothetical protein
VLLGAGVGLVDGLSLGVSVGVSLGVSVGVSVGLTLWSGPSATLEDVESDGVDVSVDELSVGVLVSVGVALGESAGDEESLGTATASLLRVVPLLPPEAPLYEEVRTVDVVGGVPQPAPESVIDACAARALISSTTTPKKASPIAAPSAAGLRSSALTVHPRFASPPDPACPSLLCHTNPPFARTSPGVAR